MTSSNNQTTPESFAWLDEKIDMLFPKSFPGLIREMIFAPCKENLDIEDLNFSLHEDNHRSTLNYLSFFGALECTNTDYTLKNLRIQVYGELLSRFNLGHTPQLSALIDFKADADSTVGYLGTIPLFNLADNSRVSVHVDKICIKTQTRESIVIGALSIKKSNAAKIRSSVNSLFISGAGRSGSTLLMSILAELPEIALYRHYPYEYRPLVYAWRNFQISHAPSDLVHSMSPDGFESVRPVDIGFNPYLSRHYYGKEDTASLERYMLSERTSKSAGHLIESLNDLGKALTHASLDTQKPKYYAEKVLCTTLINCRDHFEELGKEIFLIRDYRDIVLSGYQFNEKRGTKSFGFGDNDFKTELINRRIGLKQLALSYQDRKEKLLLVKYEDLISTPHRELLRICEYLNIDTSEAQIVIEKVFAKDNSAHQTSKSEASSIARWRNEYTDELKELCSEIYAPYLTIFGYPVD